MNFLSSNGVLNHMDKIPAKKTMYSVVLLAQLTWLAGCTGGADKASLPPPKEGAAKTELAAEKKPEAAPAEAATTANEPSTSVAGAESPAPAGPAPADADAASTVGSRFTGEVDAPRRSDIAFRVNGFVGEVIAKPGAKVKKGDVLATLDDRDYKISLELAKARKDQAAIALDSANKDYQREVQLKKENASTAAALDKMKAGYDSARLNLRLAELDVEKAQLALNDTRLVAPYDCVVADQMKHEGENVQSGNPVFRIYDTAEPEISLTVPERMIGQVAVGAKLRVTVPSASYAGQAEVIRMVPVISDKTRTFQITARLVEQDGRIVPGSYAEATPN